MTNAIGVISMFYARPFGREHFPTFQRMKQAGADVVELLVPEPGELDLAETKAATADAGLSIVLAARVNLTRDLASPDPAAHQAGIAYLEQCVDIAAALGAGIVGGPLYGAPLVFAGRAPHPVEPAERRRRVDAVVRGLAQAGKRAADKGVVLGVEPLNRFETDIICTTAQAIEVCDAVGNPGLGVMLDTFHMNMEERSIPDAIRAAGNRLVHFQANENHRGFPGTGNMDWTAIARALHAVSYEGPVSLEPFRREDDRVALPIAHWRAPHEDEDEKLRAGLGLIRSALTFAEVNH